MDALARKVVNGYEFYEKVGAGGFGVVYRALQPALGREVAIKVILPEHASHPEFIRRFELEARLIAHLEHPHIVPLYDYWQDSSGAYLVMRWLPETVRQRVQSSPFSLNAAATLLDQVAGALNVAHRNGVIHRDIKPDNLLLDHQDNTYLSDFGIAKVINSNVITTSGQLLGSMAYLAPEQINDAELTPQSDLYSLGLVMYEVLTGVQPYVGSSASALLQHHLHDPLPSVRTHRRNLPSSLDVVLATVTAKNPADRYEDAIRFARAFRAALPAARHFQPLADPLTERELEIVRLMADGLSNSEIAERLYVSLSTIKWYKKQIYGKLDAHSRETAIACARALGLISADNQVPGEPTSDHAVDRAVVSARMSSSIRSAASRLPTQTTPFIGREAEIAALMSLIRDPANRLISVLAPGGMGKTRLVLEVALQVEREFKQGAVLIALNAVSAPEHLVSAVASAVGVTLSGQVDPKQQLLEHFRRQQVLVILDNFEHLLDAAPLLTEILEIAPQVKILTTTRERLNLSVETVFLLGGLDVPGAQSGDNLLAFGAVRLFVNAARRAQVAVEYTQADLTQVGRICRLVQGMPLAILLAASWIDILKVGEIADEVSKGIDFLESQWRDLPERQRSIRAVFEASWRRLTPTEAEALARLSVFRGGFTRRAAEQVAGASLRTLSGLVNKALLWMDADGRCSIHELLRQYADEQLALDSGDSVRSAHAAYYLEALAARESDLIGSNHAITVNDIEADLENIRAALTGAAMHQDNARLAAAVHPLWLYFYYDGKYVDGAALFEFLSASLRRSPPSARCDALLGDVLVHHAHLLIFMFERARAEECLSAAEPLVEASGDGRIRAFYRLTRSVRLPMENHLTGALPSAREALALYRSIGDPWGEMFARYQIGTAFLFGDQPSDEEIREALDRARSLSEAAGDTLMYATTLTGDALLLSARLGSIPEQLALLENVLAIRRTGNNPIRVANALINVAIMKGEMGRLTDAARDGEEAVAIKRLQGSVHDTVGFDGLGETYLRMGRLAEARPVFEEAFSYVDNTEQHTWRNVYRLYLIELAYVEGMYEQAEAIAAAMVKENGDASLRERHHQMTYVIGMAGLAALARGDWTAVRHWCAQAARSVEADPNRNGAMFAQIVLGLLALKEGDASSALNLLEAVAVYFRDDYVYDMSQGWERDLGVALALTGCSRAAVRLNEIGHAAEYVREALSHAKRLNVDAFTLMALIPAAEIALASGDLNQASRLAALVANHPHTFAYDRARASDFIVQIPHEFHPSQEMPDLWRVAAELLGS